MSVTILNEAFADPANPPTLDEYIKAVHESESANRDLGETPWVMPPSSLAAWIAQNGDVKAEGKSEIDLRTHTSDAQTYSL